jgi:ArsR family transcriptional regulator
MNLAQDIETKREINTSHMQENARATTLFLKSLAHEGRLTILCRLSEGPATVGELEQVLSVRQSSVSQQLARLRNEGLVDCERDGRAIRYFLSDERTRQVVGMLYNLFCD